MKPAVGLIALLAASVCQSMAGAQAKKQDGRVEVQTMSGCLTSRPDDAWFLTSATEPVVASKKAAPDSSPLTGRNEYRLMGVLEEFSLEKLNGRTVSVTGLVIAAGGTKRVNLLAIRDLAPACPPQAGTGR